MHRVIDIDLEGQANPFRLHDDAYDALAGYLDRARTRLADDPDRGEVMGDLERSIGAKLVDRLGPAGRVVAIDDVRAVLDAVGPVGASDEPPPPVAARRSRGRRRLARIREGKEIAGVCQGMAVYSEIDVDWIRTTFIFLGLVTAGVFFLIYLVVAFLLPVFATPEAWIAAQASDSAS